jgi:hypothetical protein
MVLKPELSVFSIRLFALMAVLGASSAFADDVADAKKAIVGRWDVVRSGKLKGQDVAGFYMRFNADGTFKSKFGTGLTFDDGKYKFLSGKVIELDIPGVLFGRIKDEYRFTIKDDVLTIDEPMGLIDWEFKRVDTGN